MTPLRQIRIAIMIVMTGLILSGVIDSSFGILCIPPLVFALRKTRLISNGANS